MPIFGAPKPLVPQDPSVLDSAVTRALRLIGDLMGDDDPAGQILGIASAMEVPGALKETLEKATTGLMERAQQGIRAFHGSPHDFDKFSLDKIGTGEGAQAYGHGLYFAESEGVANSYRSALTAAHGLNDPARRVVLDGVGLHEHPAYQALSPRAQQRVRSAFAFDADKSKALQVLRYQAGHPSNQTDPQAIADALRFVEAAPDAVTHRPRSKGHMYEVAIDASPDEFLDWDKPLSQQPPKVIESLQRAGWKPEQLQEWTGREYYERFGQKVAERQGQSAQLSRDSAFPNLGWSVDRQRAEASSTLRDAGVKGIRYKDGMSRGTEAGTSNIVVFDDKLVSILRKYGVAGAIGAGYTMQQIQQAQGAQQ